MNETPGLRIKRGRTNGTHLVQILPSDSYTHQLSTMSRPFFAPPPPATTALGRHRKLSPLAGVTVSPLCLGAMSIGDKWEEYGMGAMNKQSSFKLLDAFHAAGGNFIDTANNYQDQTSEQFIGEWMETRGIRNQMVIATKVSCPLTRPADNRF